ncbi:MAG: efflux RND transporter periplasmic adaptor subunit [Micavibrio sp.]|nr:efflux RND transporter periplasmic adaptor subunit [Micavibrio sp.]
MRVLAFVFMFLSFVMPAMAAEDYICPMHPFVHGKQGDHCPICGMELVPASEEKKPDKSGKDTINISPAYMQALGVKTAKASHHEFGKTLHSYGRITPNTRNEYQLSLRKGGWIKELNASAIGDAFKKGDVLLTFYSPDLIAVETEYLSGLRAGFKPAVTEQRLRLFGMDDQAIAQFKKQGEIIENVPFHAPADGIITMLNVRRGAYVAEGNVILTIQDFSQVWVEAHVLLKDLQLLALGTPATITINQTGEQYKATVDYIYPMADSDNKEGMVRLVLDNSAGKLKTDEPVDVTFTANSQSRFAVPEQAILYSGMGAYIIEDAGGGSFRPVMVKTGITADGMTEITSGLSENQYVVTSGQFMLDAESNLSGGGMADMPGMDMKAMPTSENKDGDMDMGTNHGK